MSRDFQRSTGREFIRSPARDRNESELIGGYAIVFIYQTKWGAWDYAGTGGQTGVPAPGRTRYRKARLTRAHNDFKRIDEVNYGDGLELPVWTNTRLDAGFVSIYGTSPNIGLGLPGYVAGSTPERRFEQVENSPGRNISTLLELLDPQEDFLDELMSDALENLGEIPFPEDEMNWEHWSEGVIGFQGGWPGGAYLYRTTTELARTSKFSTPNLIPGEQTPPSIGATATWDLEEPVVLTPERIIHGRAGPFPAWMWSVNLSKARIGRTRANAIEYALINGFALPGIETSCRPDSAFPGGIIMPPEVVEPNLVRGRIAFPPYQRAYLPASIPTPSCFTT